MNWLFPSQFLLEFILFLFGFFFFYNSCKGTKDFLLLEELVVLKRTGDCLDDDDLLTWRFSCLELEFWSCWQRLFGWRRLSSWRMYSCLEFLSCYRLMHFFVSLCLRPEVSLDQLLHHAEVKVQCGRPVPSCLQTGGGASASFWRWIALF